ncbi:MAG: gliding motility lipoprotein GldD [Bacteroidales bacterium]|nr:gliding motility lipoprotein GldD [Bacteroidales bacterium]
MNSKKNNKYLPAFTFFGLLLVAISCKHNYAPKPRGYFRIDFPEKEYTYYYSDCNYMFEYPVYGKISEIDISSSEPCWINIEFPQFKGKIHITYKKMKDNLASYSEDIRTIAYKHIVKADDIIEIPVRIPEKKVFGIIYEIKGNTASSLNFYLTDSTENFISGALYFNTIPNKDSLAPVISFLKTDIEHLIETLEWK